MRDENNLYLLTCFSVFFIVFCVFSSPLSADISMEQHEALISFYHAANGDEWLDNSNWLGRPGTEHTWLGVTING